MQFTSRQRNGNKDLWLKILHVNFIYMKEQCLPIRIDNNQLAVAVSAVCLSFHFDKELAWEVRIEKKKKEINI